MLNGIEGLSTNHPITGSRAMGQHTPAEAGETFANMLGHAVHQLNQEQIQSNQAAQQLIAGNATNLHNVMISAAKANISLTAAIEIRNKVIDAYQNVMRMQI
ncbi:MAG TPA: flagellar hook-basal body complex protein FliE [Bacillales bacterium]|nr:flagellar hook-basal body complex protein FliE [Bacillales bacterium]